MNKSDDSRRDNEVGVRWIRLWTLGLQTIADANLFFTIVDGCVSRCIIH